MGGVTASPPCLKATRTPPCHRRSTPSSPLSPPSFTSVHSSMRVSVRLLSVEDCWQNVLVFFLICLPCILGEAPQSCHREDQLNPECKEPRGFPLTRLAHACLRFVLNTVHTPRLNLERLARYFGVSFAVVQLCPLYPSPRSERTTFAPRAIQTKNQRWRQIWLP